MRIRGFLAGVAMLLIGGAQSCLAMGSGPHPNVPIGVGQPQTAAAPEGFMLVGCLAAAGLLTWALRRLEKRPH